MLKSKCDWLISLKKIHWTQLETLDKAQQQISLFNINERRVGGVTHVFKFNIGPDSLILDLGPGVCIKRPKNTRCKQNFVVLLNCFYTMF